MKKFLSKALCFTFLLLNPILPSLSMSGTYNSEIGQETSKVLVKKVLEANDNFNKFKQSIVEQEPKPIFAYLEIAFNFVACCYLFKAYDKGLAYCDEKLELRRQRIESIRQGKIRKIELARQCETRRPLQTEKNGQIIDEWTPYENFLNAEIKVYKEFLKEKETLENEKELLEKAKEVEKLKILKEKLDSFESNNSLCPICLYMAINPEAIEKTDLIKFRGCGCKAYIHRKCFENYVISKGVYREKLTCITCRKPNNCEIGSEYIEFRLPIAKK